MHFTYYSIVQTLQLLWILLYNALLTSCFFLILLADDWLIYIKSELSVEEPPVQTEPTNNLFQTKIKRKANNTRRKVNKSTSIQYKCSCGRSYSQAHGFRYHKKWECGKPMRFQCNECSYGTNNKHHLQRHTQRHSTYRNREWDHEMHSFFKSKVDLMKSGC